jgi:hypothetical protein
VFGVSAVLASGISLNRFAQMNRLCTTKTNPEQRFICYDIAPDTNLTSYFDEYLEAIALFESCEEQDDNKTMSPEGTNTLQVYGHEI